LVAALKGLELAVGILAAAPKRAQQRSIAQSEAKARFDGASHRVQSLATLIISREKCIPATKGMAPFPQCWVPS